KKEKPGDKAEKKKEESKLAEDPPDPQDVTAPDEKESKKAKRPKAREEAAKTVQLKLTTARGIVVFNVPPNEVASDLRERPLTNAAKAIIRSGDSFLMDAIRRTSPKYFGD